MNEGIELPPIENRKEDWESAKVNYKYKTANASHADTLWDLACRERQFRDALKRIAELESQQAADREELRVTKRALETAVNYLNKDWNKRGVHYCSEQFILHAAAEGVR